MPGKESSAPRSRIFISYRHEHGDQHAAGRLAEDLRRHFPPDQVFQDFTSIGPGADFEDALHQGLQTCAALLVIIGPDWLTATDRQGQRRLKLPNDWVRREVAEGLRNREVRVFPVLLDVEMPSQDDLPEDLSPLTRRQGLPLTTRHWPSDVAQLIDILKKVRGLTEAPAPPATRLPSKPKERGALTSAVLVPGSVFRDGDDCPEMVVIPAGEFLMGSPNEEEASARPQHKVTIARGFAIGKYEVTFDEWDACVAAGGCAHRPNAAGWGRGRQPVINVSWKDAQAYVSWLAKKTRRPYRLPSEAEWEYAARAGTTTRYPWGDLAGTNRANFAYSRSRWSDKRTAPVGSFKPNQFGLHDMIGNVDEWVQDCWNEDYKGAPSDGSPWVSGNCRRRVIRGGGWEDISEACSSANRRMAQPGYRSNSLGIRVAMTL